MARPIRKTDYGTVVLHWVLVGALAILVATGLKIAADTTNWTWLQIIGDLLPIAWVWSGHLIAGLVLLAVAAAYAVYVVQAGLGRRIMPDRARLKGLFSGGRAQWGAINIVLYWILFLTVLVEIVTGIFMYYGQGGLFVTVHRAGMWIIIAYPVVHVGALWGVGGLQQVLRIFRPGRIAPPAPPLDVAELLVLYDQLANEPSPPAAQHESKSSPRRDGARIQANPFAVALAAGLGVAVFATGFDRVSRDSLLIRRIAPDQAPRLDGDVSDPIWRASPRIVVATQQGANFDGSGATNVEIRAAHDGQTAYFLFMWDDPTRSLKHLPLVKREDGWRLIHEGYDVQDEDHYFSDKFSVLLSTDDRPSGDRTFHLGRAPLAGAPPAFSGRGLHYSLDGSVVDVWHWRASQGGMSGWIDDSHIGPPAEPSAAEREGRSRYRGGFASDPGGGSHEDNFELRPPGGYDRPIQPKRLPIDWAKTWEAMGRIDLDPDHSESEGAQWWMSEAESEPFSSERDSRYPIGALIPGALVLGPPSGDRADVVCAAYWAAGRWTLELARRLDAGGSYDRPIATGTLLRVAAFDHSQTRHTRHVRPIRLEVE